MGTTNPPSQNPAWTDFRKSDQNRKIAETISAMIYWIFLKFFGKNPAVFFRILIRKN
jgi:hypothetical protein